MVFSGRAALRLLSVMAGLSACRFHEDTFYARNQDLIGILRAQDSMGERRFLVRGKDGELFYLEDVRAAVVKWHLMGTTAGSIAGLSEELKRKGVRLLVVPAPSKVEIYPERLAGRSDSEVCGAKRPFFRALDSLGVSYVDLRPDFFRAKSEIRIFPATDTHWSGDAVVIAARRIASRLGLEKPPDARFGLQDTTLGGFLGDLALKFQANNERVSEMLRLHSVRDASGGRFSEPESAGVVLFGDSFVAQYRAYAAHLGAHLSREFGVPVKTVHTLQGFASAPGKIRVLAADFPEMRTLIWVFTSRSLMDTLPAEPNPASIPAAVQ